MEQNQGQKKYRRNRQRNTTIYQRTDGTTISSSTYYRLHATERRKIRVLDACESQTQIEAEPDNISTPESVDLNDGSTYEQSIVERLNDSPDTHAMVIDEIAENLSTLELKTYNQMEFCIYLVQLREEYYIPSGAINSLLKVLPNVEDGVLNSLPKSVYILNKIVSNLYTTDPLVVIQCKKCEVLLYLEGKYIQRLLGNGWFTQARSKILRRLISENYISFLDRLHITLPCNCENSVQLEYKTIAKSPFFWLYTSVEEYITKLFNQPMIVAKSLICFFVSFPENIREGLERVIENQYRTFEEYYRDLETFNLLSNYFNTLTPSGIELLFNSSKEFHLRSTFIDESWHGKYFWKSILNSNYCYNTPWLIVISLLFDWYSPYKFSSQQSLAPILICLLNMTRYSIAQRNDIFMHSLGYLPTDYHLTTEKVQKYIDVFVRDIENLRNKNLQVYNSLLNKNCSVHLVFGTVRADMPAAHSILFMQSPGRAKANCRRCVGFAESCPCGNHSNWGSAFGSPNREKNTVLEQGRAVTELINSQAQKGRIKQYCSRTGVKGYCVLNRLPEFDIVYDVVFEGMHLFFFNVCPQGPEEWLNSITDRSQTCRFYINDVIRRSAYATLDARYKEITFLRHINRKGYCLIRKPHKLICDEWKVVTMLVILPLFRGLVKPELLREFSFLVKVVKKLFNSNVSRSCLENYKEKLIDFHHKHIENYKECKYKLSTHSILHVIEDIINWGHLKSNWTALSEGEAGGERKRLEFCNGKNISNSLSKITCAAESNTLLSNRELDDRTMLRSKRRDVYQKKFWKYDISEDDTTVWYTNRGKSYIGAALLFSVISDNNQTPMFKSKFVSIFVYILSLRNQTDSQPYSLLTNSLNEFQSHTEKANTFISWINNPQNNLRLEFNVYSNVNIGYIQYYGIRNPKKIPRVGNFDKYYKQGEWVQIKTATRRIYGRIRRFISITIYNDNEVDEAGSTNFDSFVIVQFYDFLRSLPNRDAITQLRVAGNWRASEVDINIFQNVGCITRKVAIQPFYSSSSTTRDPEKHLVLPWYSWC